jgi:hypothetical protein
MAKQEINIGVEGNDGTGDSIRESFRKVNENFQELYAVFGQGGTISFTTLSGVPSQEELENTPSKADQPVLVGVNVGTQGTELNFFKLVSQGFVTGDRNDDTISFDLTRVDTDGTPVIVVNSTRSSVSSDEFPTLGGNLDLAGNFIAANPAPVSEWPTKIEEMRSRNSSITIDDILITKGYADSNYLKSSGSGTGAQLRVRTEDTISVADYTFTINSFSNGNLVINNRTVDGVVIVGEGHGLDSAANGAEFVYQTTGTSAINQNTTVPLTNTAVYPESKFFIRVVSATQLSLHTSLADAQSGSNKITVTGGSGVQSIVDYYFQPSILTGKFLANEAIPRESAVRRQGDQMEGPLYLADHPGELAGAGTPNGLEDLQAVTKFYVDNTSSTSNVNFYVSLNGDDTQANTPPGKEGRSDSYAFRTLNAACRKAEEIIEASPLEAGPYKQTIVYGPDESQFQNSYVVDAYFDPGQVANYGANTIKFRTLIDENIDFVIEEVIAWTNKQIADANASIGLTPNDELYQWLNFAYNEDICRRDTRLIIESAKLDVISGINANKLSRQAGLRYYGNASGRLAALSQGEQTINVINKHVEILSYVFTNTTYPDSLQDEYEQYQDPGLVDAPETAVQVYEARISDIISIIQNGFEALPTLSEGAPYIIKIANGGNDSVWQGQLSNTDIIPGKIILGVNSGAKGRVIQYSRDADDGTNTDTLELILEEPIEFQARGTNIKQQGTIFGPILGDDLEFGERVSNQNITIFVESGIFLEDYPIRVPPNVSIAGDEFRRTHIRPKPRVSQSKWANTYFYRDKFFDGLTLHPNTVAFEDEIRLTLDGPVTVKIGDVITQETTSFTYDETKCRRDLGYILDGVGFDVALGTNYNAVTQGLAYQRASVNYLQSNQLSQTLSAINFAKNEVLALTDVASSVTATTRARFAFDEILDILDNGVINTENSADTLVFPSPVGVGAEKVAARDKLQLNRSFIKSDIIAFISNQTSPPVGWDPAKLSLDVGFWVDAITYDILYGGDDAVTTQARLYFTDNVINLTSAQRTVTVAAVARLQTIVNGIVTGQLITRATGNSAVQNVSGANATSVEGSEANARLEIIRVATNTSSSSTLGSPTKPSVGWATLEVRTAKTAINNNTATIIDDTIEFIDSNTGTRATVQQNATNSTTIVVTYNDGYIPNGPSVSASSPFNTDDLILLNGNATSRTPTVISVNNSKDFNMGWHWAQNSRKPVNTNAQLSVGNRGNYLKAAEIMKDNKRNIQLEVVGWIDSRATADAATGFGTFAETTLVLTGVVSSIQKGETLTQATTGASGLVKSAPVTSSGQTTIVIVSPSAPFNTVNQLTGSVSGSLGANSVPASASVGKFTFSTKCFRDIGFIVDGIIQDLIKGRNDQALEAQGKYYENAVEVGQEELTSQAISRISSIATALLNINGPVAPAGTTLTWKLDFPAAEPGTSLVVSNLINTITFAFNPEYNPPLNNKDMDVFLMNDATIIRNVTVQGHGGFMTVLDPDGQILTKSPYIQTGSSFSQSVNKQAFRGGMFVDGFVGNMPIEIVGSKDGSPYRLYARSKRDSETVNGLGVGHGLFVRRPQLPAPFYINGIRYQVNAIANYNPVTGTCELILDPNSGTRDGNDNGLGWLGPVIGYEFDLQGVRQPVYGNTTNYPTILQTAGNRSMLGNDFTQINDLGYGLLVTNTGLSEMVGMFTYYCHQAFAAYNGSEIRAVGGSNAYGNFALVAGGSDPNEVAQTGTLAFNTVQTAKVYTNAALQYPADEGQNFVYVYDTDFIPLPEGEIDITFTERKSFNTFAGPNTITLTGHGFESRQKVVIQGTTGVTGLNDTHFVERVDANTIRLYSNANLSTARSFSGTLGGNGVIYLADGEGDVIFKYEVVNVVPAFFEDGVAAVNQRILTLSGNVAATYGATVTQSGSGAVGKVVIPQRTLDGTGNVIGGTTLYVSQADGASSFTTNPAHVLTITDTNGVVTTAAAAGRYITAIDDSDDTSNLPIISGNGAVWKISFSNQSTSQNVATGGLAYNLYGGESVTIRTRAKAVLDNVESVPIRPSTAVVFSESSKVYRSISFSKNAITNFGETADRELPEGQNILTFDSNYNYLLNTVDYGTYEAQVRLVLGSDATVPRTVTVQAGETITQASTGASAVVKRATTTNSLILTNWNNINFNTTNQLTGSLSGSLGAVSVPAQVYHFGTSTFGSKSGDTRVALTSGITDPDALNRLNNANMIFGWKDRVHTVVAYHDGQGNSRGTPSGASLQTGFAYFEISPTPLINKNNEAGVSATGIARPLRVSGEERQVVLSTGIQSGITAEITVNISLCRVTGHDLSNIGTGGFNTSNYPNIVFGAPAQGKAESYTNAETAEKAQVWERDKGRVFYSVSDEDGFFRVGKFFEVDQGTGTVKFAAQINISGLDGLGFRDGETINKFTGDSSMSPIDNSTVPTTFSVNEWLDRRLGFDRNMIVKTGKVGDGFLPQKNPILTQTLDVNSNPTHTLNMTFGRIVQMNNPVADLDGANKQYIDRRVFANDSFEALSDVELNEVAFADQYGKDNLIVMTGNRRVYVKNQGVGSLAIGNIITGYATASAARIVDLQTKTLDNNENIQIVTYSPLRQTRIVLSANLATTRGQRLRQPATGAEGTILWPSGATSGNGGAKTIDPNEIVLHSVTGTFSTNPAQPLTLIAVDNTQTVTTRTVVSVANPSVIDFENERIENTDGVNRQTTGGSDSATVRTKLEFANAKEAKDLSLHGAPGTTTRSDVNVIVTRLADKTEVNLQLQEQSIINNDVNTFADIGQEKLKLNNAPILPNSNNFVDASTGGQRTKQANQGVAAFDASTFAEDQVWTLSGAITVNAGDIITQSTGARRAFVVTSVVNASSVKVRTSDTFATGTAVINRLSTQAVNAGNWTKGAVVPTILTISTILPSGYINIKDRSVTFDKIQEIPEKTVIGRADISFDGNQEGAGEVGIARAIPFSLIVDEGGALQDQDFANSNVVTLSGIILTTVGEITLTNGDVISQVGNTLATGTVQGDVNTENRIVLINTSGTFNTTGQLTKNSVALGVASRPTNVSAVTNLTGTALTRVSEGIYGTTAITKNGAADSLVRTYASGDTVSGVNASLNLAGWINVRGLMIDNARALDTASGNLEVYTPGDHLSMRITGSAPGSGLPDTSRVIVPTASLTVGDVNVLKTAVGGAYNGFASNFQQNAEANNPGLSKPYIVAPWVYTNFIQAPDDLSNTGTGIAVGGYSSFTADDEIALIVNGATGYLQKYSEVTINTTGENRITISDGTTTIRNNLSVGGTSTLTGNVSISGSSTLAVGGVLTANAGVRIDNITIDGTEIDLSSGSLTIDVADDIILDADGANIIMQDGGVERINIDLTNNAQQITTQGTLEINTIGDFTIDASGDIILDADGADWLFKDNTTNILTIKNNSNTVELKSAVSDADFKILGNDGGVEITALTLDMSEAGDATFNRNVSIGGNNVVTGNLTVNGNTTLGNDVASDTLTINSVITNNELRLRRVNAGAEGFRLLLQHTTDSSVNGDVQGEIVFLGTDNTNAAGGDQDMVSRIVAKATNVINSIERTALEFYTAAGSGTDALRLTITDTGIVPSVDIVPGTNNTRSVGTSSLRFSEGHFTTTFGAHRGNLQDTNGNVVAEVGTTLTGATSTIFRGRFEGPLTGGVDSATNANNIRTVDAGNGNTNYFILGGGSNLSTAGYQSVVTHGTFYYNPSTDVLHSNNFSGTLLGNILGTDGATTVLTRATTSATLTGTVSSISNHTTDGLGEGSTNLYFSQARARGSFSAGTGITISGSGVIAADTANIVATTANNVKITNTNDNATFYPTFTNTSGNSQALYSDTANFAYNASTNTLTVPILSGTATSANYADLAERYLADLAYEPGTVLVFGGTNEVTQSTIKGDRRVAGVVSTNPAHLMNAQLQGETVIDLALQGRVPCKVIGQVQKGDILVTSAIPGYAMVDNDPKIGTIIGKAVGTKLDNDKGVVEVVVGRV